MPLLRDLAADGRPMSPYLAQHADNPTECKGGN
jgi:hypothetical protein